jgi:acetyl-CoA acetyltransferase
MTIAIAGVGETDYVWQEPRRPLALAIDAVRRALDDAGLAPSDVDGFVLEDYTLGHQAPVEDVAERLGVRDRAFTARAGIAGAGIVNAPALARLAIEAGLADVVVSYYAINLSLRGDGGAYRIHAGDKAKAALEMPFGYYGQPVYFAAAAALYAHTYGVDPDDFGGLAVSARQHAQRTPNALKREPLSRAEYRDSPMISTPLRKLDCCLVSDGGVAFVMTSLERARDLKRPPVVVAGCGFGSKNLTQAQYFSQNPDLLTTPAVISGPRAFGQAGLTPADVDVAEVYDCFTISLALQLEDLGLAGRGEAVKLGAAGAFAPGGTLPVNTHGGLLSQAYLVGGNHVVEAVRQLRGERGEGQVAGAEVALVTGLGAPEHATLLLTTDR